MVPFASVAAKLGATAPTGNVPLPPSGRVAARTTGATAASDEAWTEVVSRSLDADTPGMHAQFACHWQFAEFVQPGKTSWNLEPWRPVVDDAEMVAAGCNPGGQEEPF